MSSVKPLSKIHQRIQTKPEDRPELGQPSINIFSEQKNTFWDDANALYEESIQAIATTHGQLVHFLNNVINDPERLPHIRDPQTLVQNINLLSKDIEQHVARLNAIHAKHADRKGSTTGPDDIMLIFKINGEYADALEVYDTLVSPTVAHIFEQIGAIEELLAAKEAAREAAAQAALTDVNVVSDVVIKSQEPTNV